MIRDGHCFGDILKIAVPRFGLQQSSQINPRVLSRNGGGRRRGGMGRIRRSRFALTELPPRGRKIKQMPYRVNIVHEASPQLEVGWRVIFY